MCSLWLGLGGASSHRRGRLPEAAQLHWGPDCRLPCRLRDQVNRSFLSHGTRGSHLHKFTRIPAPAPACSPSLPGAAVALKAKPAVPAWGGTGFLGTGEAGPEPTLHCCLRWAFCPQPEPQNEGRREWEVNLHASQSMKC